MPAITGFRHLKVWQKAIQLSLDVYHATKRLPVDERYGLTGQMRRAVASVGATMAEGYASRGRRNRARFFALAKTSAEELRHYIILTHMLGLLSSSELAERPMLYRLWESNCPIEES
jgi:four helix bundle protein